MRIKMTIEYDYDRDPEDRRPDSAVLDSQLEQCHEALAEIGVEVIHSGNQALPHP